MTTHTTTKEVTMTNPKPNRYAAKCSKCGGHVNPGAGRLVARTSGGRWTVIHTTGMCGRTGNLVIASSANTPERRDMTRNHLCAEHGSMHCCTANDVPTPIRITSVDVFPGFARFATEDDIREYGAATNPTMDYMGEYMNHQRQYRNTVALFRVFATMAA